MLSLAVAPSGLAPSKVPSTAATLSGAVKRGTGDSVRVRLGPDIAVPLDSASGALTAEPAVAIHDSVIVVSWNDSHGGHRVRGYHDVGSAVSLDNGRSFRSLGFLPDSSSSQLPVGGDSRLAADNHGTFFLETLTHRSGGEGGLNVYALEPPSYASWKHLSVVAEGKIVDKPAFIRDDRGKLVLAFMKNWAIVNSVSADGGRSWSTPVRVSDASERTRSGSAVVSCGNELWVAWMEGGGGLLDEVWATRSRNGGRTFEPAHLQYPLLKTVAPPAGYALGPGQAADLNNDVGLACTSDRGTGTRISMVIVEGARDQYQRPILSRVLRFHRALGATRWSGPADLTKDDGPAVRVFPSVAVAHNTLGTLYYEAIADQGRTNVDVLLQLTDPRGQRSRVKLNEVSPDWRTVKGDNEYSPGQHNFGDYISLASDGRRYVAAWTDGREGRSRIHVRVIDVLPPAGEDQPPISAISRGKAVRLYITFIAGADSLRRATQVYDSLWASDGARMTHALETAARLTFAEIADTAVRAIVFEGVSSSGYRESPMHLRASYPVATKKATLMHELGHRLESRLFRASEDDHQYLFLWLYPAWVEAYGEDFAREQVAVERRRGGIYPTAWDAVLALSPAARGARWDSVRAGRVRR